MYIVVEGRKYRVWTETNVDRSYKVFIVTIWGPWATTVYLDNYEQRCWALLKVIVDNYSDDAYLTDE